MTIISSKSNVQKLNSDVENTHSPVTSLTQHNQSLHELATELSMATHATTSTSRIKVLSHSIKYTLLHYPSLVSAKISDFIKEHQQYKSTTANKLIEKINQVQNGSSINNTAASNSEKPTTTLNESPLTIEFIELPAITPKERILKQLSAYDQKRTIAETKPNNLNPIFQPKVFLDKQWSHLTEDGDEISEFNADSNQRQKHNSKDKMDALKRIREQLFNPLTYLKGTSKK